MVRKTGEQGSTRLSRAHKGEIIVQNRISSMPIPAGLNAGHGDEWWEAANILRGTVDAAYFMTYVFPLLFFNRISDVHDEEYEAAGIFSRANRIRMPLWNNSIERSARGDRRLRVRVAGSGARDQCGVNARVQRRAAP